MNDPLTDNIIDHTIQTDCSKDQVMMACKKTTNAKYTTLAWAARKDVFKETDDDGCGADGTVSYNYIGATGWDWVQFTSYNVIPKTASCNSIQCQRGHCSLDLSFLGKSLYNDVFQGKDMCWTMPCEKCSGSTIVVCGKDYRTCATCTCNGGSCEGNEVNGVIWYRNSKTWGFASQGSTINLHWVDVATGTNSKRLSMHVNDNNQNWSGGHRCGSTAASYNTVDGNGFDDANKWELVFYHADAASPA